MTDILQRILAAKREEVAAAKAAVPSAEIGRRARAADRPRDFVGAIRAPIEAGRPAAIAEIKRASPPKGPLRADFDTAANTRSYESGSADRLTVLNERT